MGWGILSFDPLCGQRAAGSCSPARKSPASPHLKDDQKGNKKMSKIFAEKEKERESRFISEQGKEGGGEKKNSPEKSSLIILCTCESAFLLTRSFRDLDPIGALFETNGGDLLDFELELGFWRLGFLGFCDAFLAEFCVDLRV